MREGGICRTLLKKRWEEGQGEEKGWRKRKRRSKEGTEKEKGVKKKRRGGKVGRTWCRKMW